MGKYRVLHIKPHLKDEFNGVLVEYRKNVQDPAQRGAIFMAVCRGTLGKGPDFADANGRAVIIVGIPFLPVKHPLVILKQQYRDENNSMKEGSLTGQQWHELGALRASFKQQLSAWLTPHIKEFDSFKMMIKELRSFFQVAGKNFSPQTPSISGLTDTVLREVPYEFDHRSVSSISSSQYAEPRAVRRKLRVKPVRFDFESTMEVENSSSEALEQRPALSRNDPALPKKQAYVTRVENSLSKGKEEEFEGTATSIK
ncbi:hypothetical protein QAD02_024024 [Eretmocerus hayati]|uniref:Uncharacterized protein n=1 Tax=Eretmocerus hayati TaxID=131215 RepID=A0ACC2PY91_9HYME|nr:hypothetical protein QAD02_024024 [Eretmocerus hayati]